MRELVLSLNSGSSSLKACLLEGEIRHISCLAEALGTADSVVHMEFDDGSAKLEEKQPYLSHEQVLCKIVDQLNDRNLLQHIVAVGHRVVHGGTIFSDSVLVTDDILTQLDSVEHLAPL